MVARGAVGLPPLAIPRSPHGTQRGRPSAGGAGPRNSDSGSGGMQLSDAASQLVDAPSPGGTPHGMKEAKVLPSVAPVVDVLLACPRSLMRDTGGDDQGAHLDLTQFSPQQTEPGEKPEVLVQPAPEDADDVVQRTANGAHWHMLQAMAPPPPASDFVPYRAGTAAINITFRQATEYPRGQAFNMDNILYLPTVDPRMVRYVEIDSETSSKQVKKYRQVLAKAPNLETLCVAVWVGVHSG